VPIARAVLLAVTATLFPLPAAASDKTPAPKAKATQVSLRQTIAREAVRTPLLSSAGSSRADQSNAQGATGFFKSKPGMIALAVMAVGTGYALYSASHDKINSPGRK
jgi:hypothetical protein